MPHRPVDAPETHSTAAPGYCAEPARTPTTPRVYLCAAASGTGSSAATSSACSALDRRVREVEAEVDEVHRPAGRGGGVDEVRDLVGAEGDGHRGPDVRPVERTGVHVHAGGSVDRDDRDALERRRPRRRPRRRRPPRPADADDAVDDDVRAPGRLDVGEGPSAGRAQGGEPRGVGLVRLQQQRLARRRRGGPARARRTARRRRCRRSRPAAAPGRRTPGRAARRRRRPARPRPAASSAPSGRRASSAPRRRAPARPCVRSA